MGLPCAAVLFLLLGTIQSTPVKQSAADGGFATFHVTDQGHLATEVGLGSPPQKFTLQIDAGSAHFWVASTTCGNDPPSLCSGCPADAPTCRMVCPQICCAPFATPEPVYNSTGICGDKRRFNQSASSTFEVLTGAFADDWPSQISGIVGRDTLKIGTKLFDSMMLGITNDGSQDFPDLPADGVFGLGFSSSTNDNFKPPLVNAFLSGQLFPNFTVTLALIDNTVGRMSLGKFDNEMCEMPTFQSLSFGPLIQFPLLIFSFGSEYRGPWTVAFSTTSEKIEVPQDIFGKLAKEHGFTYESGLGYTTDCDKPLPDLKFELSKLDVTIRGSDLLLPGAKSGNRCGLAIKSLDFDVGVQWLLGLPLLRSNCVTLDYTGQGIGFSSRKEML